MLPKLKTLSFVSLRESIKSLLSLLRRLPAENRADAVDILLKKPITVATPHGKIRFLNHGRRSCWRARTTLTKEPDSIAWIDAMEPGSVFWDIGANVGVLTLYAATRGDLDVWAFEPAAVKYYNLVANCELNRLEKRVRCFATRIQRLDRDRGPARLAIAIGGFVHVQGKQEARRQEEA